MTTSTFTRTEASAGRPGGRATRIAVRPSGSGVVVAALDAGDYLVPRVLERRGRDVRIALVGRCAMLVAGDRVELELEVGAGVRLELVEPSGTVAYNARGGAARWCARAMVAEGGVLSWQAAPLVVAAGADLTREVRIELAEGGRAAMSELVVLGRSGEAGGVLRARQRVTCAGRPLLVEELELSGPELPGILGGHRVLGTVAVLGQRPAELPVPTATYLAGPGALGRVIGDAAHVVEPELSALWGAWRL